MGGRADLESHRMHTIGDPEVRIREDPVRTLRAVRFAARLGFTIAPDTFEAMRRHAGELARCAPARVLEEIFKILRCGGSARAFELLRSSGALPVVLPALGAALEGWSDAARRGFYAHLAALDRLVRSGAEVSEAVLLATLVSHLGGLSAPDPEADADAEAAPLPAPRGSGHEADDLLASLVSTSRLPRKVAERVRLALNAQRHFKEPAKGRRRGRKLSGQSYFVDALQLLEISVAATGQGQELLDRWRQRDRGRRPRSGRAAASGPSGPAARGASGSCRGARAGLRRGARCRARRGRARRGHRGGCGSRRGRGREAAGRETRRGGPSRAGGPRPPPASPARGTPSPPQGRWRGRRGARDGTEGRGGRGLTETAATALP